MPKAKTQEVYLVVGWYFTDWVPVILGMYPDALTAARRTVQVGVEGVRKTEVRKITVGPEGADLDEWLMV